MTVTEVCLLTWAILGMIEVAILLRVGGRKVDRRREVSD
jgi:hypothetical protein